MKLTIASILTVGIIVAGGIIFVASSNNTSEKTPLVNNVSVVNGKQIIEIEAKGGYSPRVSAAKADMPTILRVKTQGTFDCSIALSIPSIGFRKNLPPAGITDIPLTAQKQGTTIRGICAMGMYSFAVNFN